MTVAATTLHLSALELDPRDPLARRDLGSGYELHRTLCRSLPPEICTDARLLFRVEPTAEPAAPARVLVQARAEPDWSFLDALPGHRLAGSKVFTPDLPAGRRLRFRLRANPVVSKRDRPGSTRGRRVGLVGEQAQVAWLTRKGEIGGFAVEAARARDEGYAASRRGGARTTHLSVLFEGVLVVTDPGAFSATITDGVGPSKGFGFGLLSIAPA